MRRITSLAFIVCLSLVFVGAGPCNNIQLGGSGPCQYSTSDCMSGTVQWNYPTKTCQWTFAPRGASSLQMSATWATASYVNLSFYDGIEPTARRIGFVSGEHEDERQVNVTSNTGVVFVKLQGPPSMMTYALIFEYHMTAKIEQCSVNNGNCQRCLAAGCSMLGASSCVPTCPSDATCWSAVRSSPEAVCANRQTSLDKANSCAALSSCSSCLSAQCRWGGMVGSPASCMAGCGPLQMCEFVSTCPAPDLARDSCSQYTTCEGCLNAGCSMQGPSRGDCVAQCVTDTPCFTRYDGKSTSDVCAARKTFVDKTDVCASKSTSCGDCLSAGCSWNTRAARGEACITGCGFFPCELATNCLGVDGTMMVAGQRSSASTLTGSICLAILVNGLL